MCNLDKIVERCKKGDRKAGEQLYNMFSAKMFAICIQYSKSREEAEDNLQDGFIKILESIRQYTGKGSFEGWMKRIFINTALEKYRKNRSLQVVEEVPEVMDEDDIDDNLSIPSDVLFEFVNQLPEKYRLVFNLYVMENMQHKEIAAMLGISDGTSKSNLARAKDILKKKINAYLRDE
ncbi:MULTISPECIES: RNA polymerase sigma factor [Butyricimonas]|uniref:Sigma-70 family RNA polymerase sigma factor n=1 Tax=Butyricimonas hominis TaxID=2763032 RepID=A0ABR7CYC7_9BACT|nr:MULTISPECIES: sigma-70 family RNA polymerase sigma factor [Butyricimonas]MBC5620687.1 sigma-70 family RNA polymerase sigma factor [Butyricimonas hominis]MCB6970872.1 sigma-70 family RNA polymerase sigma factor [Butyricimonas synergistica]MCG4517586.1 sigma-70 family RNA polymerase sigma factor [Butyricimonas sp. DFI.6.44]